LLCLTFIHFTSFRSFLFLLVLYIFIFLDYFFFVSFHIILILLSLYSSSCCFFFLTSLCIFFSLPFLVHIILPLIIFIPFYFRLFLYPFSFFLSPILHLRYLPFLLIRLCSLLLVSFLPPFSSSLSVPTSPLQSSTTSGPSVSNKTRTTDHSAVVRKGPVAQDFGGFSPQAIHLQCIVENMTVRQCDCSHQPNFIVSVLHSRVSEQLKLTGNTS
jgi:hypothetical protein